MSLPKIFHLILYVSKAYIIAIICYLKNALLLLIISNKDKSQGFEKAKKVAKNNKYIMVKNR